MTAKKATRRIDLTRPLTVLDLETTGLNIDEDRIVQIGILKVFPDRKKRVLDLLVNPEMKIPAEASDVHGITDRMVRDEPPFEEIAEQVATFLKGCDLAGFNILSFDLPLLENEFERVDVRFKRPKHVVDAKIIYHDRFKRDLAAAYEFYCDSTHEDAHSALADVRVCWQVLKGQVKRHEDLPASIIGLAEACSPRGRGFLDSGEWFVSKAGRPALTKTKEHKGRYLDDLAKSEPGLLQWILTKTNPPKDTIEMIQEALRKVR